MNKTCKTLAATLLFSGILLNANNLPELHCTRFRPAGTGGFISTRGEWALAPSRVQLSRGAANNLNIRFEAEGSLVKAKCQKDDCTSIFGDESAEFFLMPPDSPYYYHLAVNPLGAVYSAKCVTDARGHRRDESWNPKIKTDVKAQKDRWIAELEFAPDAFEGARFEKNTWKMNFTRNVKDAPGAATSSWTGSGDFNNPATFGTVKFDQGGQDLIEVIRFDGSNFSGVAHVHAGGMLSATLDGKEILQARPGGLDRCIFSGTLPIREYPIKGESQLTIRVGSPNAPGDSRSGSISYGKSTDLRPDQYYYAPGGMLKCEATLVPHAQKRRIELYCGGTRLKTVELGNQTSFTMPLKGLAAARYELRFRAEDQGQQISSSRIFLIGLPKARPISGPAPGTLGVSGTDLTLNDQPLFLFGGSTTAQQFLTHPDAFNMQAGKFPVKQHHVDIISLEGLRFVRKSDHVGYITPWWDARVRQLRARLAPERRKPNEMIRSAYEASMKLREEQPDKTLRDVDAAAHFAKVYSEVKKIAPERIFSIQLDHASAFPNFKNTADVYELAYWQSSYAVNMMKNLDADMSAARRLFAGKPVIFWLGGTIPNNQVRTAEEIRAGLYLALAHDIGGVVIHMGHGFLPQERSRLWSVLSHAGNEINSFYANYRQGRVVNLVVNAPKEIRFAARKNGDTIHLIAVNLSSKPIHFDVKLRGANQTVLRDSLSGFEPKHYTFKAKP